METNLDVVSVNRALDGTDWLAVTNTTDTGFNLLQLEAAVNDGRDDLDLHCTTDALPVLSAREVAGGVRFILNTVDSRSEHRILVIETSQKVEGTIRMAA